MTATPWLTWSLPMLGAVLTPLFGLVHQKVRDYAAVAFTFVAALSATLMAFSVGSGDYTVPWIPSLGIRAGVLVDPLSVFMSNIVAWISFLIMVYSLAYMKGDSGMTRYWFFMNFFIGSMLLLVLSDNLLQMLFGWEGVGLCSYALIGHWYRDEEEHWVGTPGHKSMGVDMAYSPSHAGLKAFVMTRIGDIALLIAIFLIFAYAGTFNYLELGEKLGESNSWATSLARSGLLVPAAVLFFGGPIGKSAQFPLHEWLPDAMAGPTAVSALIHAATMVKAGVYLVGRMGPIFFQALTSLAELSVFFDVVAWIGAFTAFLAATQAMVSREVKKVLAYSTVSQIGYMMLGLGIAGVSLEFVRGYSAGLMHLMSHAVFKASMFMAAGAVIHTVHSRFMDDMGGLGKTMKFTRIIFLLAGFSLIGIPPLSGFWTKDAVMAAGFGWIETSTLAIVPLAMALGTVFVTGFYTTRMMGLVFFGEKSANIRKMEERGHQMREAPLTMLLPYSILGVASLVLGLAFLLPGFELGLEEFLAPEAIHETMSAQGLQLLPIALSIALAAGGLGVGWLFYIRAGAKLPGVPGVLRQFLVNRWYINPVYYLMFVRGTLAAARGLFRSLEQGIWDRANSAVAGTVIRYSKLSDKVDMGVVDRGINEVASGGSAFSNLFRRIQTGITQQYVAALTIGIFLLIAYMFYTLGV